MKLKQLSLLAVIPLMLLTSCGPQESKSSDSVFEESSLVTLTTNPVRSSGCSFTGFFNELSIGRSFAENSSYEFIFESNITQDPSFRVVSSREESVTVQRIEGNNRSFNLVTHYAGDSIIKIYNSEDELVFRNVMKVRKAYSQETIEEAIYNVDYFHSSHEIFGDWRMSALSLEKPLPLVLTGGDDYEQNKTMNFTIEFDEFISATDCYCFDITTTQTDSETQLTHLCVTRCCDVVYLYYFVGGGEHLLTELVPNGSELDFNF